MTDDHSATASQPETAPGRPSLILIGGSPASGKTTLAAEVARALGLPLFRKDGFKEALADALTEAGASIADEDVEVSRRLGLSAVRLLYNVAGDVLDAGQSCVLESNFHRGLSETDLRPLLERADGRLIHCEATREVILARYQERDRAGERHPVHLDADRIEDITAALDAGDFAPLDLPVPTLRVDTTDGYRPSIAEVIAWVQTGVRTA